MDENILTNNITNPPEPVPMPSPPLEAPSAALEPPMASSAAPQATDVAASVPVAAEQAPDAAAPAGVPGAECAGAEACPSCRAYCQDKKQMVYDWLGDAPELRDQCDFVEVQFKNTRKGYYLNHEGLDLHKGDFVAVEGNPGHDIGEVTLTGYLVHLQMKKSNFHFDDPDAVKKVFRLARPGDMERYREAKAREHETMLRSRKIAEDLGLEMKIGDVEYQGDGNKAIFYYIADGRVDFRQLIKVLAEAFRVRIEMRQIGARQEAGRIGGIGPCGRELCCSKWMTRFQSVGTAAARFQDLSLNPQKLAGQCAKLKCCLNYEVDGYMEAHKDLPGRDIVLYTQDSEWHLFKTDILARTVTYSTAKNGPFNTVTITAQRAFDVYHMNKHGQKPESLKADGEEELPQGPEFTDGAGDEDISRFDRRKKRNRQKNRQPQQRQQPKASQPQNPQQGASRPQRPNNAVPPQQQGAPAADAPQPKPQQRQQPKTSQPQHPQQGASRSQRPNNAAPQQQGTPAPNAAQPRTAAPQPRRRQAPSDSSAQPPQPPSGDPGPRPVR